MAQLLRTAVSVVRSSFSYLMKNDPLRLAGATAFFSTFALPAIVLIILQVLRLFLPVAEGNAVLLERLNKYVGDQTAVHLNTVLKGFDKIVTSPIATLIGFLFILFVGTTLFKVIKNSLNQIWDLRVAQNRSVRLALWMRLKELVIIIAAGVLFLLVIFLEGLQSFATKEFVDSSGLLKIVLNNAINLGVSVVVTTAWFGLIFAFLPDGRFPLRISIAGAFFTSLLFTGGKLVLRWMLLNSDINMVFGRSAAIVLLLLFVFYTSLIFYFGASFTMALADHKKATIKAHKHAVANN